MPPSSPLSEHRLVDKGSGESPLTELAWVRWLSGQEERVSSDQAHVGVAMELSLAWQAAGKWPGSGGETGTKSLTLGKMHGRTH